MAAMRDAETFTFETVSGSAGQSQTMSGQARFSDAGMEMKASSTGAQAMEMVILDKALYIESAGIGTGEKWFKVDMSDPDSLFGSSARPPTPADVQGNGGAQGVRAARHRGGRRRRDQPLPGHMEPARYAEAMDLPAEMAEFLPKEIGIEMWVDGDDQPRKFHQELEMPDAGGGAATSTTTEGTYYDFGTDVEIEAPPAAEVADNFPGLWPDPRDLPDPPTRGTPARRSAAR